MFARRFGPAGLALCVVVLLSLAVPLPADEIQNPAPRTEVGENPAKGIAPTPAAEDVRQAVRKEIARYRSTRTNPKQRAAALKELAALGDEGAAAAKDLLDKELQQAETTIRAMKKPSKLDANIEKLRKTLADLRHDPDLSKDQLHKVGLPALDQLNIVYQQRAKAMAAQSAKNALAAESLRQMTAVLQSLREQWPLDAPLPVKEFLHKAQSLLTDLSSPEEEQARAILAKNQAMASQVRGDVRGGMDALNSLRMTCGLPPLLYDARLCEAARGHCSDMETRGFFSHESPVEGKKTPWDRAQLAGTTASGENIYTGSSLSADALKAWYLSPGHHKNMLSESARRQGLGHEGKYWTLMLGDGAAESKPKRH